MEEIDFGGDSFDDVTGKDTRYDAKAYALLMDVIHYLGETMKGSFTGGDILEEFKTRSLEQYGPMTYTVLTEWGVTCTEDVGEMMFNLADSGRVHRDESDTADCFASGYDFKEAFLDPYQV